MEITTHEVLAGCYLRNAQTFLTHSWDGGAKTLCKRIKADHLADEFASNASAAPTCPSCLKRDPRFNAKK